MRVVPMPHLRAVAINATILPSPLPSGRPLGHPLGPRGPGRPLSPHPNIPRSALLTASRLKASGSKSGSIHSATRPYSS